MYNLASLALVGNSTMTFHFYVINIAPLFYTRKGFVECLMERTRQIWFYRGSVYLVLFADTHVPLPSINDTQ